MSTPPENNKATILLGVAYSLYSGINECLYRVGVKCLDLFTRRKTIILLKPSTRHEGLWDAPLLPKVVERAMEIEGSGFTVIDCSSVPEYVRVQKVRGRFIPMEKCIVARFSYDSEVKFDTGAKPNCIEE